MDIEHDVQKPNNDNEFKCDICEQLFVDKSTLMHHIKKQHNITKHCKYFAKGFCVCLVQKYAGTHMTNIP